MDEERHTRMSRTPKCMVLTAQQNRLFELQSQRARAAMAMDPEGGVEMLSSCCLCVPTCRVCSVNIGALAQLPLLGDPHFPKLNVIPNLSFRRPRRARTSMIQPADSTLGTNQRLL